MSPFAYPPEDRYFEDYIPGAVHEFGSITVDEDEVLEFGKRYVPLSYHTDKQAAKQSIYGGAIASGWHTAALMMRLYTTRLIRIRKPTMAFHNDTTPRFDEAAARLAWQRTTDRFNKTLKAQPLGSREDVRGRTQNLEFRIHAAKPVIRWLLTRRP